MAAAAHKTNSTIPAAIAHPPVAIARTLDACRYISVSRALLYRLVKDGKLRPVQIGARARGYLYTDLDAFLAAATAA